MKNFLFKGDLYAVRKSFHGKGDGPIVVAFPHAGDPGGLDRGGFGESWLRAKGFDAYILRPKQADWFQNHEIFSAFDAMLHDAGARDIVTYGASMGAYGALMASGPLKAVRVFAASPQFHLDPSRAPFDHRWAPHHERIGPFIHDIQQMISRNAQIVSLHDPRDIDGRHMDLFAALPNWRRFILPYGGHQVLMVLAGMGSLGTFTQSVLRGDMHALPAQSELLRQRRKSPVWLRTFGLRSIKSNRPMVSEWAATRCDELGDAATAAYIRFRLDKAAAARVKHAAAAGRAKKQAEARAQRILQHQENAQGRHQSIAARKRVLEQKCTERDTS